MSDVLTIASYGIRESVRRRVFVVVAILTLGSGILYVLGAKIAFHDTQSFSGGGIADTKDFTGATVFGMAMFGTLFLGAVLAAFLTLGVIRGDTANAAEGLGVTSGDLVWLTRESD